MKPQALSEHSSPRQWHKRVVTLAVPIILSNITVPLVGIVDTAVMGRMAEPKFLGATAIGAIVFSSVFWLFGFLRMGTGGLVAQAVGARDAFQEAQPHNSQTSGSQTRENQTKGNQTNGNQTRADASEMDYAICRALLIALILSLLLILLRHPIINLALQAFTASAELKSLVLDYYHIRIFAAPATLIGYACMGALIGLQNMRSIFMIQLLLNGINIVLTIAFFEYTDWGIKGVALATVIAEYAALILSLVLLQRSTGMWPLQLSSARLISAQSMRQLFEVNGNLFVRTLCLTLAFYWLTQSGSRLGELTLAANAILIHMVHFMSYALDGFSHAAETLCGYAYGKRNPAMFRAAARTATIWAAALACIFCAIYLLFGESIVAMMTTLEDVRMHAHQWLLWIALAPLIAVWSFLLDGIFIGTTRTREMRNGMVISLLVFVASNLLLVSWFGNTGLWMSYFVLMIARAVTLAIPYPRLVQAVSRDTASNNQHSI